MASSSNPKKKKGAKDRSSAVDLFSPSEMSEQEYNDLVEQIRTDLSVEDCQVELMDAARYGDVDVVRAILKVHSRLHEYHDARGKNTALHMAAANGHVPTIELLLQLGADASLTNQAGNTPLHWASSNGQENAVEALLQHQKTDVLQQNEFGRSALTEGFTSQNTDVVKRLLEHESATEERLVNSGINNASNENDVDVDGDTEMKDVDENESSRNSVTHDFLFRGTTSVRARELAIAESDKDSILGQANPSDDTTGLGIWAASLVLAQWLVSKAKEPEGSSDRPISFRNTKVVELGAGCGIPALALGRALATTEQSTSCDIYATDFNPKTVDNLQHNIDLNAEQLENIQMKGMMMNWQDPSTWPSAEPVDIVFGSDLIYQSDMVPLLVQTIRGLLSGNRKGRFLYVARSDGQRQGHTEFMEQMSAANFSCFQKAAPPEFTKANILANQDDDLCFLHFHELSSLEYTLFEFYFKD